MKKNLLSIILLLSLFEPVLHAQTWRERRQARFDAKQARSASKIERKKLAKEAKAERFRKREDGPPFFLSNSFAAYATPTAVLNLYGAVLPVGATYYFGKRFSISADVSVPLFFDILNIVSDPPGVKHITSDFGFHGDIKWYVRVIHTRRFYVGFEGQYRSQDFYKGDSKEKTFHKVSAGGAALFGAEFRLRPRLLLEGKLGAGLREVTLQRNFYVQPTIPRPETYRNPSLPAGEDQIRDKDVAIYLPLAFTIKYILN